MVSSSEPSIISEGTSTNVGPKKVRRYKSRTVQTSDLQTSDWYKRRTGTNVRLRQTSDQYKRQTSTNVGRVHLLGKTSNFGWISKKDHSYKKQIKIHSLIVIKIKDN